MSASNDTARLECNRSECTLSALGVDRHERPNPTVLTTALCCGAAGHFNHSCITQYLVTETSIRTRKRPIVVQMEFDRQVALNPLRRYQLQ